MTSVPVEKRLAFGQRRQMVGIDETAHGDRPQIGHDEFVVRLERLRNRGIERHCRSWRAVEQAEKDDFRRSPEVAGFCQA